jgi:dUTPase
MSNIVTVLFKNIEGLTAPFKANSNDAGYDVIATTEPNIVGNFNESWNLWSSIDYIEYGTNLFVAPQTEHVSGPIIRNVVYVRDFYLDLRPRSSICKYNLVLSTSIGLIDPAYRGEIKARFKYIAQPMDYSISYHPVFDGDSIPYMKGINVDTKKIYQKGDRIAQLVAHPVMSIEWVGVDMLPNSERGEGGFGSSGK